MATLTADSISKSYGRKRALVQVSLEIAPGEVVAVLGKNGAGKSTLLRSLSGLGGVDGGRILLDGEPLKRTNLDQRRRMILLEDNPLVAPNTTVIENVAVMNALWNGESEDDIVVPPSAHPWLEKYGMLGLENHLLSKLSRGQFYKAALVAALSTDAEIWLIDEPWASGMDAQGMAALAEMFSQLRAEGKSIVFTTQFPEVALKAATRAIVIEGKGIVFDKKITSADLDELNRRLGA